MDFILTNVVTIMTSPLCGTLAPAPRLGTEVQGIGVQILPHRVVYPQQFWRQVFLYA